MRDYKKKGLLRLLVSSESYYGVDDTCQSSEQVLTFGIEYQFYCFAEVYWRAVKDLEQSIRQGKQRIAWIKRVKFNCR